jgi:hypothetical protein
MEDREINTTTRWNRYCRASAKDGRVCDMYSEHEGKHRPHGGNEEARWEDGE